MLHCSIASPVPALTTASPNVPASHFTHDAWPVSAAWPSVHAAHASWPERATYPAGHGSHEVRSLSPCEPASHLTQYARTGELMAWPSPHSMHAVAPAPLTHRSGHATAAPTDAGGPNPIAPPVRVKCENSGHPALWSQ